jgi:hypothetical protein
MEALTEGLNRALAQGGRSDLRQLVMSFQRAVWPKPELRRLILTIASRRSLTLHRPAWF